MLAAVEWAPIGESVLVSLVAGIGIVAAFAGGVRGLVRAGELREDGREAAAVAATTMGALGVALALGATVAGVIAVAST